ncbi:MAG: translocation/assembly module TamB domain-containing protein [Proteobacteria bacterium]|nr:translocation/assembly module TamB domain-containing protein [Pseudomonadota bacterium]
MRRILLVLAGILIVTLIVAPFAAIWSVLYTTGGAQFVARHLPRHLGSVNLQIEGISGTIAGGLHADRVVIEHELINVYVEGVEARVDVAPLLLQKIRSPLTTVRSARLEIKKRVHPATPGPPGFLPRWLQISVDQLHVGSTSLSVYNGFKLQVDELNGGAVLRRLRISLFNITALLEGARVGVNGDLRATDPFGMAVRYHLDWHPEGQPAWTVSGSALGDLNALNLVAHAGSPFRADITGQLLDLTEHFHWAGDAALHDFDLEAWGIASPLGHISGHVAGTGDASTFSAHGPVDPAGLQAGVFEVLFEGGYAGHVLTAKRAVATHVASGAQATASGTLAIVDHGPRLDLSGTWEKFRWPLVGRDVPVRSAAGSFTLQGVLPYQVHLSGEARAAELPPMPVDIDGLLGKDRFSFTRADVELYGGHATASGEVVWAGAGSWDIKGRATDINPGLVRADLPGSLSFNFTTTGRGFSPQGTLSASFSELSGRLRGASASGAGTITHRGKTFEFANVRVAVGGTSLALDGQVDERLNLRFALNTQDLGLLVPGSHGQLKAAGTLAGTLAEPAISATAHGREVDYQGIKVAAFDSTINFDPGATDKESHVEIAVHKLSYQKRTLDAATVTLQGLPSAYTVHLTAAAPGLAASLQARGAYAGQLFKGQLTALSLTGNESLHLTLDRPVDLLVSASHVRLEWMCVNGTPGSICADGDWTPAAWSTTASTNELPLATLTAGRAASVQYLGTGSAHLRLNGGAALPTVGTLRARLEDAVIAHRLASKKIERTRIGSGTVSVDATPSAVSAELSLGEGQVGTVAARLDIQPSTARWQDMPLSGELHAHSANCDLISLYVPQIDRAAGQISTDLTVSGTVGAPHLSGLLKISDGEIDAYQVNLALRQITLEARLGDAGLDLKTSAKAGAGTLSADGHMEWRDLVPYGKFRLQGTNLRLVDVPEAQIDASPDLLFDINGHRIEVTGKVVVPYAKIAPKDITGAVRASEDEVIVGQEDEDAQNHFEVMSDITLTLGDRVSIDTLGLTGRLTGSIAIRSGYDAITRGTGELSVANGSYTAYARKLDIQKGRLIFTGGPIDNPGIDLRAAKVFPDVTAGVNVRGTLLQPRMSFFSDPPLTQSQIVSLILAGGSLESTQKNTPGNAALAQAAALLASQVGSHVGIQDVSLETDVTNDTSLVLGRYLSPRLYVSYGISLTEQINTLKLRYTLGDHWTVKTEVGQGPSGQISGIDLVYSIEK